MARRPLHVVHVICTDAFAGAERAVTISASAVASRGHRVHVIGGDAATMRVALEPQGLTHQPAARVIDAARAVRAIDTIDVLHAHMTAAEAAALLSGRSRRVNLVVTRHFAQPRGSSASGRLVRVAMAKTPHHEIAISRFVADAIAEPCTIVPFGLPERAAVPLDTKTVVVIQRLEAEKDTATALRAWHAAKIHEDGWRLQIAGDGAQRGDLEALAAELGVASSVTFLGRVHDVDALRAQASLQLTTAPREHFGLSVLEAMAVGLPVVATSSGAHRELLADNARWFAPGDAAGCAVALREAALDASWRTTTATALQARQRTEFSFDSHGRQLEDIYLRPPTRTRLHARVASRNGR